MRRLLSACLAACAMLSLSMPIPAQVIPPTPNTIVSTGDSFVRRAPCSTDYNSADAAWCIKHEHTFHTYLNSISAYELIGVNSSARGGETCSTFPSGHPLHTLPSGPWAGQIRGLSHPSYASSRLLGHTKNDTFAILLGINDVNLGGVSSSALSTCLQSLYYTTAVTGNRKVIAMTYPPISPSTQVWGNGFGPTAAANVSVVNGAIRSAVIQHNLNYPTRKVHLAETSLAWTSSEVDANTIQNPPGASIDGAHPNALGAMKIARVLYKSVCDTSYLACTSHY